MTQQVRSAHPAQPRLDRQWVMQFGLAGLPWKALELLQGLGPGTLRHVFSVGIILQEVLTRGPPYGSSGLSAEDTESSSSFLGLSLTGVTTWLERSVTIRKSGPECNHTDALACFDHKSRASLV